MDLSWTNPTITCGGTALTAITSVVLTRDGETIQTFNTPTVGGTMTFTDNTMTADGAYEYAVYAVTDAGNGLAATLRTNVGNVCEYRMELTDSYGDGWNGASIEVYTDANTRNASTATVEITVPELPQLQLVSSHDILCYGASTGSLSVAGSSGTPPYSFAWTTGSASNPANGATSASLSSLAADTYTVTLTDGEGCTATGTYTLQYLSDPMVAGTLSEDQLICSGGLPQPLSVTGCSGGADSYYVWQQSTDGTTFTDIAGAGRPHLHLQFFRTCNHHFYFGRGRDLL